MKRHDRHWGLLVLFLVLSLGLGAAEDGSGPAHVTLVDPDGNAILIDQHF